MMEKRLYLVICISYQFAVGCNDFLPLGMSNGLIRNEQLSSSSASVDFSASNARKDIYSGWCSGGRADWKTEWLQIDFKVNVTLKGLLLQSNRKEEIFYVTSYYLQYSHDGVNFGNFTENGNTKIFNGLRSFTDVSFVTLPSSISSRIFRFRANTISGENQITKKVCARLEFYGCGEGAAYAYCKSTFPLGIGNGFIDNYQMTSSSNKYSTTSAFTARLNSNSRLAWCASSTNDEWLQIDLLSVHKVAAISIQGDDFKDQIGLFTVKYGMNSTNLKDVLHDGGIPKVFAGNTFHAAPAVYSQLPTPVEASIVRIYPQISPFGSGEFCCKTEIYGYPIKCTEELSILNTISKISTSSSNIAGEMKPFLFSENSWCSSTEDDQQFIRFDLTMTTSMSGVAIQANLMGDSFIKSFHVGYIENGELINISKVFSGVVNPFDAAYVWFDQLINASTIFIKPQSWSNKICGRFQLFGCANEETTVSIKQGHDLLVEEYEDLQLICSHNAHWRYPIYEWKLNNVFLVNGSHLLNYELRNLTRNLNGSVIECSVVDSCGEHEARKTKSIIRVEYFDTPRINSTSFVSPKEGDSLIFLCEIVGSFYSSVTVNWLKNGIYIARDSPLLVLKYLKLSNDGIYECETQTNKTSQFSLPVEIKIQHLPFPVISNGSYVNVIEGQTTSLSCSVRNSPHATINWLKDGEIVLRNSTEIRFLNVSRTDSGIYKCMIEYSNGPKYSQNTSLTIEYMDNPIVKTISPLPYREGDTITIVCEVDAVPHPLVQWVNAQNTVVSLTSILYIKPLQRSQSGQYVCSAKNSAGEKKAKPYDITATYLDQPQINSSSVTMVPYTQSLKLHCSANGNPQPNITWTKNGIPLPIKGNLMHLKSVSIDDSGVYRCVAVNHVNSSSSNHILVTIIGIPIKTRSPRLSFASHPSSSSYYELETTALTNLPTTAYSPYRTEIFRPSVLSEIGIAISSSYSLRSSAIPCRTSCSIGGVCSNMGLMDICLCSKGYTGELCDEHISRVKIDLRLDRLFFNNRMMNEKAFKQLRFETPEQFDDFKSTVVSSFEAVAYQDQAIAHQLMSSEIIDVSYPNLTLSLNLNGSFHGDLRQTSSSLVNIMNTIGFTLTDKNATLFIQVDPLRITANDLDECSTKHHNCSSNATCHNSLFSYTCQCHPGLIGNGFGCYVLPTATPSGSSVELNSSVTVPPTVDGKITGTQKRIDDVIIITTPIIGGITLISICCCFIFILSRRKKTRKDFNVSGDGRQSRASNLPMDSDEHKNGKPQSPALISRTDLPHSITSGL